MARAGAWTSTRRRSSAWAAVSRAGEGALGERCWRSCCSAIRCACRMPRTWRDWRRSDFARGEAIAPDLLEPAYLRDKVALTLAEQQRRKRGPALTARRASAAAQRKRLAIAW
jgi:hypothetical protein